MGDANSIAGQLLVTPSLVHSSRSVQCNQTVQFTKTAFTHFSLFFGGPSLSTRDQDRERDFMGDANSIVGQQLVTHLLCTVQDLFNTVCQSRFQNNFHTLLFIFWWTKSQHHRSRLRKRLYRRCQLHCGSALSHTISCTWFKI